VSLVYRTTDGGRSWQPVPPPGRPRYWGIDLMDARTGNSWRGTPSSARATPAGHGRQSIRRSISLSQGPRRTSTRPRSVGTPEMMLPSRIERPMAVRPGSKSGFHACRLDPSDAPGSGEFAALSLPRSDGGACHLPGQVLDGQSGLDEVVVASSPGRVSGPRRRGAVQRLLRATAEPLWRPLHEAVSPAFRPSMGRLDVERLKHRTVGHLTPPGVTSRALGHGHRSLPNRSTARSRRTLVP